MPLISPLMAVPQYIPYKNQLSSLSSWFLNVLMVSAKNSDSGKLFHAFVARTVNEYFLKS